MKTFYFDYGDLEIRDLTPSMLKKLQKWLPLGFLPLDEEFKGARYGFVVRCGEKGFSILKQRPVECNRERALKLINIYLDCILSTLWKMADEYIDGIYYATPFLEDKGEDRWETGVVHFIFPSGNIIFEDSPIPTFYDNVLCSGGTALYVRFMKYFRDFLNDLYHIDNIRNDVVKSSQISNLVSGFMLMEDEIIYHGTVQEDDPVFRVLVQQGLPSIFHAPSIPITISPDQLKIAKGKV